MQGLVQPHEYQQRCGQMEKIQAKAVALKPCVGRKGQKPWVDAASQQKKMVAEQGAQQ